MDPSAPRARWTLGSLLLPSPFPSCRRLRPGSGAAKPVRRATRRGLVARRQAGAGNQVRRFDGDDRPLSQSSYRVLQRKLLEPLPGREARPRYLSFSRYYDLGTARFVEGERMRQLGSLLTVQPRRIDLTLVEHVLSDWGWEHGRQDQMVRSAAFGRDEIFEKNLSSLSFFKSGYVGQVGVLEFFDEGVPLAAVRTAVSQRRGLSGASIYRPEGGQMGFVVFSEFFKAPPERGGSPRRR
jgi:hypothetical protein